jgi:UDP-N-acetylmuramate--alanine ligase
MKHVHFIGIGGTGLSAMALFLLESGVQVSGSDRQLSPLARQVQAAGGRVFIGHQAEQVLGADLVVRSSAIPGSNVEVRAAHQAGIPVYKRADFLEELTSGRQTLAVDRMARPPPPPCWPGCSAHWDRTHPISSAG